MSRWPIGTIGDLCFQDRVTVKPGEQIALPYLGLENIESETGHIVQAAQDQCLSLSFRFGPEHVLYGKLRPYLNKVACPEFEGRCSTEIIPLRPKAGVLREYLSYSLRRTDVAQAVTAKNTGSRMPRADMCFLLSLPIPLPPLTEQRRIVDLLNHAASIRRLRQQALETARAFIPALFVKMFGDPARNEKGWEVTELGNLVVEGPQNGLYKHISSYGDGTPILRIDAFYDGAITDLFSLRRLRLTADEIERYGLCADDIVINRVNSPEYLGKSAIVPALPEPTVFESNMMRFSVDPKVIASRYLIQYLQTGFIKQQILGRAKHAINQSSINQQDVKSFPVMVPPIALQQTFAARVADLHALITQQERHLVQAEALLQSLMARFFGGAGIASGVGAKQGSSASPVVGQGHAKGKADEALALPLPKPAHDNKRANLEPDLMPVPIAAEAPATYSAGGQAALPAANQPVPARILAVMALGRDYSRAELLAATGISTADWTGAIRQLKEEGRVIQAGEKRGARYQLAKKGGRR